MGLKTFWPLSQEPKIGHLRKMPKAIYLRLLAFSISRLNSGQTVGKMHAQKLLNIPLYNSSGRKLAGASTIIGSAACSLRRARLISA